MPIVFVAGITRVRKVSCTLAVSVTIGVRLLWIKVVTGGVMVGFSLAKAVGVVWAGWVGFSLPRVVGVEWVSCSLAVVVGFEWVEVGRVSCALTWVECGVLESFKLPH